MLRHLLHIVLTPFFQALVVTGLIILFVSLGLRKYSVEQLEMNTFFDKNQISYTDLDYDGKSERIQTLFNPPGNVGIAINSGNATLGQWNFKGIYQPGCSRIMFGDYNQNGSDEIYIFTLVEDSVMLHAIEYSIRPSLFIKDRFIVKIGASLKAPDYIILPGSIVDMTGDGKGDLVFVINACFSRRPRNVFVYDITRDSLKISPESGAYIENFQLSDLEGDGFREIILSTFASDNFNEESISYKDTSSYLMVLDHNLLFLFPPVEFPVPTGSIQVMPIKTESGETFYLCRYSHASPSGHPGKLFLADLKGNIIREKELQVDNKLFFMRLLPALKGGRNNVVLGAVDNNGFTIINENLEIFQISDLRFSSYRPSIIDIDQDGQDEIIILSPNQQQHIILRDDFSSPVTIDFPVQSTVPLFSVKLNGDNPPQLSVQGDQEWRLFNYGINPVYRLRFLIWLGIYLVILGFILLIRQLYSFQLKKKYETEQKITRLQLSGIKAQMEPHFIMNTINTIGSSIYRQKGEDAYRQLLNFSGMVRALLISSDKLTRTLKEETEFVTNYLELEKSRFGDLFSYSITQDDEVNPEAIIPKMIIQIHAENALKHGLLPKKTGGLLDIAISKEQEYLVLKIADNGIGRSRASKNIAYSTGKGMKILGQLFETYNKYNKVPLHQEIIDVFDEENNPAGTLVKVYIPLAFNAEIY